MNHRTASLIELAFVGSVILSFGAVALAAPLSGNSTSTFVAVYSSPDTLAGYGQFTYVSSTDTVSLTNLNVSTPIGVSSGGSATANFTYGILVASGTQPFTTISPGAAGNLLTSTGSSWVSTTPSPSIVAPFTFGEDVGTGKAVYMSDGTSGTGFQVDTGGTLDTNLQHYYKLEESSGSTRVDAVGSSNLTDTNNVGQATGKVNNAAEFTRASNQNLSASSDSTWQVGTSDASWAFWIYVSDVTLTQAVWTKWDPANTLEWAFYISDVAAKRIELTAFNGAGSQVTVVANNFGDLSNNTWYFIQGDHKNGTAIGIAVNNGTFNTASLTAGTRTGTTPVYLGRDHSTSNNFGGRIDEAGFWKKQLTSQEWTDLYNSGSGQTREDVSNGIAGRVYATSASDSAHSRAFVGFAAATTTASSTGNVVVAGLATVSTNLTVGKQYYLANASGTISTTPGTVTRRVGISVSLSTLNITNIW